MKLSGITSIFGADLIRIDDEIVRVNSVGVGSTNIFLVTRAWMGTANQVHASGSTIEKLIGDFNIVGNTSTLLKHPLVRLLKKFLMIQIRQITVVSKRHLHLLVDLSSEVV